jgi:hypothetical protein
MASKSHPIIGLLTYASAGLAAFGGWQIWQATDKAKALETDFQRFLPRAEADVAFGRYTGHGQVILKAGVPFEFTLVNINPSPYDAWALYYEAENGPASITLTAQRADSGAELLTNATPIDPRAIYARPGAYRYTVTSQTDQTFRRVRYLHLASTQTPVIDGYVPGLCAAPGRCPPPITPAATLRAELAAERAAGWRLIWLALIPFGLIAASRIGFFNILTALFPSRAARDVRTATRKAAKRGERYNFDANEGYREPPSSLFRLRQDKEDLHALLAAQRARNEALRAELAALEANGDDTATLTAQLEAAAAEMKRLSEKLDQRMRRS